MNNIDKLQDIIYFETTGKNNTLKNINKLIEDIKENTNITNLSIEEKRNGYYIYYTIENNYKHEIFCYTLSEIIIHLRYIKKGGNIY